MTFPYIISYLTLPTCSLPYITFALPYLAVPYLVLFVIAVLSSDVILHPPRNTAVVANDVLRISCGTNSSHSRLRWYHTPSGSSKASAMNERETATLEKYREFGLIPGHNGSYDLYTGSVRISHSGIYTCKVTVNHKNDLADLLDATAHVIVLRKSQIKLSCVVILFQTYSWFISIKITSIAKLIIMNNEGNWNFDLELKL